LSGAEGAEADGEVVGGAVVGADAGEGAVHRFGEGEAEAVVLDAVVRSVRCARRVYGARLGGYGEGVDAA
jgi:hypothetical protein